jgi:hypothetical protein
MSSATVKIGEELSLLHGCISTMSTADGLSLQKSDISAEHSFKILQAQDQLSKEMAALTAIYNSSPWTEGIEQNSLSIRYLAEDASVLTAKVEDQLCEEIAALTSIFNASPWTEGIEQVSRSIRDLAADANILTARVAKLSAEFATSQSQMEASRSGLSKLRHAMRKELADFEVFQLAVLRDIQTKSDATALQVNNALKDSETKNDATALQLKDWLDGLVYQVIEHTTRLDGLTPQVEASRSGLATLRQEMQKEVADLRTLKQEMHKEVADLRMASQGHREAIEAIRKSASFQLGVLRDIQSKSDATALQLNNVRKDIQTNSDATALQLNSRRKDIEIKSDATALQLKDRLTGLVSQVLEHKKSPRRLEAASLEHTKSPRRIEAASPRVEVAESKISK